MGIVVVFMVHTAAIVTEGGSSNTIMDDINRDATNANKLVGKSSATSGSSSAVVDLNLRLG